MSRNRQREDQEQESNAIEVINVSAEVVRFEIDGTRHKLKSLEAVSINKAYALPRQLQEGRDPVPSTIELLTNKKVLAVNDTRAKGAVASRGSKQTSA